MACLTTAGISAADPQVTRDLPYVEGGHARQVLDVYTLPDAKNRPVVFWIHGGGWQTGDKSEVALKPRAFVDRGFVFVAANYRLLPDFPMETIVDDVATAVGWTHRHIRDHGGDPTRLYIMGHSAGAQLAALLCTDERYLAAHGVDLKLVKGCVPVDGDTYDIPAIIELEETRRRVHRQPQAKFGHRQKFGDDPAKHVNFSAVTHVKPGKLIPPFLILYLADHPYVSAQAERLAAVLTAAKFPVKLVPGRETNHRRINDELGTPGDPVSAALFEFVGAP
jgi:acetyl esterase/lipase